MLRIETFRQLIIISGLILCSVSDGFIFGQMSGMVDALRGGDGEIILTDDAVSWIASIINVTCICGSGVVAVLAERIGRRGLVTILSTPVLVSYIMVYFGNDMITFLISRIIIGVCYGGVIILTYIAMSEYTSPSRRAFCINIISALGPSVGTVTGHILSILLHWRTVALIGLIPAGLSAILPFFWIESPSWLATQGRFEECKKAFQAIHGKSKESEAELNLLIDTEKKKLNNIREQKPKCTTIIKLGRMMKTKYFWKLFMMGNVVNFYRIAAGKLMFSTLAITMIQEMTDTSNILLYTLAVDGFGILGSIFSFFSLSKMKMRPLLFSLGFLSNIILLVLSACIYFIPRDHSYYASINITLLAFYFFIVYTGPYSVSEVILIEIYPLDIKLFCILLLSPIVSIGSFLSVYLAPMMFTTIGYHGVFLLNSVIIFSCLTYFWFFLPETKGRTLQEIELYFKTNKFHNLDDIVGEQATVLL